VTKSAQPRWRDRHADATPDSLQSRRRRATQTRDVSLRDANQAVDTARVSEGDARSRYHDGEARFRETIDRG
jgi:hypothetical protein